MPRENLKLKYWKKVWKKHLNKYIGSFDIKKMSIKNKRMLFLHEIISVLHKKGWK